MEKVLVFEVTSHSISVMVGLLNKKQTAITFSYSREYSNLYRDGQFINKDFVVNELKDIYKKALTEAFNNGRNDANNVIVTIPASTLSCHTDREKYSVVSTDRVYREIDLKHFRGSIRNKIADPTVHVMDFDFRNVVDSEGNPFDLFTFEKITSSISADYNYYTISKDEFLQVKELFDKAAINVKTYVLSKIALIKYLTSLKNYPDDFVLIDIQQNRTELCSVCSGLASYSLNVNFGLKDLFERIHDKYMISLENVRKLVFNFGLDTRTYLYPVIIFNGENEKGDKVKIYQADFNTVVSEFFNDLIGMVKENTTNLLQASNLPHTNMPFLFIGNLLNIPGFISGLQKNKSQILFYKSNNPCALKQSEASLLAVIAQSERYLYLTDIENKNESAQFRTITRGD